MPAQQCFGPHEQSAPTSAGQQPCQARQHRPISPVHPRPGDLSPQHRHLMTQHQNSMSLAAESRASNAAHLAGCPNIRQTSRNATHRSSRQVQARETPARASDDFLAPTESTSSSNNGALDAATERRVIEQLAECDGCERYLDQFRQTIRAPSGLPADRTSDADREALLSTFRRARSLVTGGTVRTQCAATAR